MRVVAVPSLSLLLAATACNVTSGTTAGPSTAPGARAPALPSLANDPIEQVDGGDGFTCARRRSGRVQCWGAGSMGQLGDGTSADRNTAGALVERLDDATDLALGRAHACALKATGQVACWGTNDRGQLGDGRGGKGKRSTLPVTVKGVSDAVAIASGEDHTCVVRRAGTLACWGENRWRQQGIDARANTLTATDVPGLAQLVGVAAGSGHTCALRKGAAAVCFGQGDQGQMGDGGRQGGARPRLVRGTEGATAIAAGKHHTCIRSAAGRVACWGANAAGQSTGAAGAAALKPTALALSGVAEIHAGEATTCARLDNGTVRCWGASAQGRLGTGSTAAVREPALVQGLAGVQGIGVGKAHACAFKPGRELYCWGSNDGGALGNGAAGKSSADVGPRVSALDDAVAVSAGSEFTCARRRDGSASCWGRNDRGQLGNGSTEDADAPVSPTGLADVVSIAAGGSHACAVTKNGRVSCWGSNASGQLGTGGKKKRVTRPTVVPQISDAVEVAAGLEHTCVRRRGGQVTCWGDSEFSQTGAAAGGAPDRKVAVNGLRDASSLSLGEHHSCAVRASGAVACWGSNQIGQLGNGAGVKQLSIQITTPVAVAKLTDAAEVGTGGGHSCARRRTGQLACWGRNDRGQLGSGTETNWTTRVPVKGITDAVSLSVGHDHTCIVRRGGAIVCWGDNTKGRMGTEAALSRVPVRAGFRGTFRAVAAGGSHTCGLRDNGQVQCLGDDTYGQRGEGLTNFLAAPVLVRGI